MRCGLFLFLFAWGGERGGYMPNESGQQGSRTTVTNALFTTEPIALAPRVPNMSIQLFALNLISLLVRMYRSSRAGPLRE